MTLGNLKENFESLWDNLAEGWRHLRASASGALTSFKPGEKTNMPPVSEVDDSLYQTSRGWAMLGGNLFEDQDRLVAQLEVPGMSKEDIDIEVREDALLVSGDKHFEQESTQGRWRVVQCAYGSFRRVVPLPVPVKVDKARATYANGVLRIELPKAKPGKVKGVTIKVE